MSEELTPQSNIPGLPGAGGGTIQHLKNILQDALKGSETAEKKEKERVKLLIPFHEEATLEELSKPEIEKSGSNEPTYKREEGLNEQALPDMKLFRDYATAAHQSRNADLPFSIVELNRDEHGGTFPYLPGEKRGRQFGIVTSTAPTSGRLHESLTPELLAEHHAACGQETTTEERPKLDSEGNQMYEMAQGSVKGIKNIPRSVTRQQQGQLGIPMLESRPTREMQWEDPILTRIPLTEKVQVTGPAKPYGEKCRNNPACPLSSHIAYCNNDEHDARCQIADRVNKTVIPGKVMAEVIPIRTWESGGLTENAPSEMDLANPKPLVASRLTTVSPEELEKAMGGPERLRDAFLGTSLRHTFNMVRGQIARGESVRPDPEWSKRVVKNVRKKSKSSESAELLKNTTAILPSTNTSLIPTSLLTPKPTSTETPREDFTASRKVGYANVGLDQYVKAPACRFCDDPAHWADKGEVTQTSTAPDGRPLYAHAKCENSYQNDAWNFINDFNRFDNLDSLTCNNCGAVVDRPGYCPNCIHLSKKVVADFVTTLNSTVERETASNVVNKPNGGATIFSPPKPTPVAPMQRATQADTIGDNGTAEPPK